ncbi:MAG: hypothetical protein HY556_04395 [Euryarchaeota archaeon]|nr:hypothetical protein [Euryarchaeota archaeon]
MSEPKWLGLVASVVLGFSAVNTLLATVRAGTIDDWTTIWTILVGSMGLALSFVVGWVSASGLDLRAWWAGDGEESA